MSNEVNSIDNYLKLLRRLGQEYFLYKLISIMFLFFFFNFTPLWIYVKKQERNSQKYILICLGLAMYKVLYEGLIPGGEKEIKHSFLFHGYLHWERIMYPRIIQKKRKKRTKKWYVLTRNCSAISDFHLVHSIPATVVKVSIGSLHLELLRKLLTFYDITWGSIFEAF